MTSVTQPFFTTSVEKCPVCRKDLGKDASVISMRGWDTFKKNAEEWSKINLPICHEYYAFTQVYEKVRDVSCF